MATVCLTNFSVLVFLFLDRGNACGHTMVPLLLYIYRQRHGDTGVRHVLVFMSVILTKTAIFQNRGPSSALRWKTWDQQFFVGQASPLCFQKPKTKKKHIASIVKPARCTDVSNLFYFGITLYMFLTVFPSIIRSSRLYIEQQEFVKQILLSAC